MNLDTFRNHFWNIATVVAVVITILIGISFFVQIRESSGIAFGKIIPTKINGEQFNNQQFTIDRDGEFPKSAKVALIKSQDIGEEKAIFLAKVFKIDGSLRTSKDADGNVYVSIVSKEGSLTYNLSDGSWNYSKVGETKISQKINSFNQAEKAAEVFLIRLNLKEELRLYEITPLEIQGFEFQEASSEVKADEFLLEYTKDFEGQGILNNNGQRLAFVRVSKEGVVTKASYQPVEVDKDNLGTYPITNLSASVKRLKQGLGTVISSDGITSGNLTRAQNISFNKIELVYVADKENSLLVPFWVFKGRAASETGEIEFAVLVNAIVDKYLKD
ncbi:hypothetical protein IID23_01780 [Patescibacteria group bacterium]|nr:hypothetical protein [Patescibacteria group bacterium]